MPRAESARKAWVAVLLALGVLLAAPTALAEETLRISVDYTIEPGAYDNAVRVGNVTDMSYPRIVIDRDPASAFFGTIYVAGLAPFLDCAPLVLSRSTDGGRTFGAPRVAYAGCLTGHLDLLAGPLGVLYAATWGATILRSTDGGTTWEILAALDATGAPTFLAFDHSTGALIAVWVPFDSGSPPGRILFAASRDGGFTWTAPRDVLPPGRLAANFPQVAALADRIVVSFISAGSPDPFVAATASQDGGVTWSTPTALSVATPCMWASAPSIAVSPEGTFAVSWYADPSITTWSCWDGWGNGTTTFVRLSGDGGTTWSPAVHAGGPPVWATFSFGDAIAFDDRSTAYVTWHSIAPDWEGANVYVASSTAPAGGFEEASFTTRLQEVGGNSSQLENLAAGPEGRMFLLWELVPFLDPDSGIFVREVAGEAVGDVEGATRLGPGSVTVDVRDAATGASRATATWTGTTVTVGALPPGAYVVWLRAGGGEYRAGDVPVQSWGLTHFTVLIGEVPATGLPWFFGVGLVGAVLAFSSAVVVALKYTHLRREDVLQRKVRLLMFEYVRDHPGASFTAVRDALGLQNGVAAYHLGVLDRQGLVHSQARRRHRWYYPNGDVSLWKDLPLSPFQASLLEALRRSPGIGIRELARAVGRRPSSVKYSLENLSREGLVRIEREARRIRCYRVDDGSTTGSGADVPMT